ncbi:MAG TPA: HEAT repeat domain-containing protein, partial [Isosphaeraceae bacterium]|nr:HEAT repeat domain-containing protein [Isosphaeraceae bacterium]
MRIILPTLLVVVSWLHQAQADEQRTVCGKPLEVWIRVFRDKTSTRGDRVRAVWALGCFGKQAQAAVPDLMEELRQGQLKDEATDALVRIGAGTEVTVPSLIERFLKEGCQHLTGMGTIGFSPYIKVTLVRIGGPAVPALLDVLQGPNRDMRVCAAEALGEIGPPARAAVTPLIRAIEHPENEIVVGEILSGHAVRALGRIGPEARAAVPALNGLIGKEGADDFELVMALDRIGVPPVGKLLDSFLRDGDDSGVYELTCLGPKARAAAPALRGALMDKRPQVRINAAVALARIDPSATEAIPVLIEALNHLTDETLDVYLVPRALGWCGPRARSAMPALIGLVKKDLDDEEILKALVLIDPEGKECVPALISALKCDGYVVVHVAANCLSLLGPKAKDAVLALAEVLTRDFKESFANGYDPPQSAANALRRIGPQARSAIPALIAALKYRRDDGLEQLDSTGAAAAAQVLGSFGPEAKVAVPALMEAVQTREKDNANWSVRKAALLALGRIGPDAKPAIPVLRNLMKEDGRDPQFLPELMVALYQLAPDGKELAELWLEKPVSLHAVGGMGFGLDGRAIVLGAMGRTSLEIDWRAGNLLEQLDSMLTNRHPLDSEPIEVFEGWFEMLASFGPAGKLAIPRLNEYRKDPNPWI